MNDDIMYGKNKTECVVGIEYKDKKIILFKEDKYEPGVTKEEIDHEPYVLFNDKYTHDCVRLSGDLEYKYARKYTDESKANRGAYLSRGKGYDSYMPRSTTEGALISKGITFYKGMKPNEVSVLFFDIETTGINPNSSDAKILSIATTYTKNNYVETKLFSYDEYINEQLMIRDLADYIRKCDPSIISGFNILGFDLPYICARHSSFRVGRNASNPMFNERTSEKRKDKSQSYTFTKCHIFGRQVVDLLHVVIDYDIANGRKLPSYKLKEVIKYLGLEKANRAHFDASKIKDLYLDKVEWEKIKAYNTDDAEDCLRLFNKIWEPFFYLAQHIPMTFEDQTQISSGSKINSLMIRAYLQQGHSIPKGDVKEDYVGGISFGVPGIYENIYKVDVASLYPSIILSEKIEDKDKDPLGIFLRMVRIFTDERLKNKDLFKKSKDQYYDSLQGAQKIFINSCYGFLGTSRLNFNSMKLAEKITVKGQEILTKGIDFAKKQGKVIVNADTDSFSFSTNKMIDKEYQKWIISLNSLYSDGIVWENDGYYAKGIILKAKNYVLVELSGEWVIKGNSIKATMKEPALKKMIIDCLELLLNGDKHGISNLYNSYVIGASNITDSERIKQWASKKTVTKSVIEAETTTQKRLKEAISEGSGYSEADKFFVFFETKEKVTLVENFRGIYDKDKLYEKIFKTIQIFSKVVDTKQFPNFKLKRNRDRLQFVLAEDNSTRS